MESILYFNTDKYSVVKAIKQQYEEERGKDCLLIGKYTTIIMSKAPPDIKEQALVGITA